MSNFSPNKIIIHCTDSGWANLAIVDSWHRQRGFDEIGYHFLILNENTDPELASSGTDGFIQFGRSLNKMGAHCLGQNNKSIGIALVGKDSFSKKQMASLSKLVDWLIEQFNIDPGQVFAHREFNSKKTCPNFDIDFWMDYRHEEGDIEVIDGFVHCSKEVDIKKSCPVEGNCNKIKESVDAIKKVLGVNKEIDCEL